MLKHVRKFFIVFILLTVLLPLTTASAQTGVTARSGYTIWLRIGPATTYAGIARLPANTNVPVTARSQDNQWLLVDHQGVRGWSAGWLMIVTGDINTLPVSTEVLTPPVSVTTNSTMKLRAGPGTTFAELARIPANTRLTPVARNADTSWLVVNYQGQRGWVARWLVTASGDLNLLPLDGGSTGSSPSTPSTPVPTATPSAPATPTATPASPSGTPTAGYTGYYRYYNTTRVRSIYQRGQQLGRNPAAFSKVGDSESANQHFLQPFTSPHDLGAYSYLGTELAFYSWSSFSREGESNIAGLTAMAALDPIWANPSLCHRNESPLACEYRINNPAVALILVRTFDSNTLGQNGVYHEALRELVQYSIDQGVIPVLSTIPHHIPQILSEQPINALIRQVAAEYQVPLWDLWETTERLPSYGIDFEGPNRNHLNVPPNLRTGDMVGENLNYGKNRRNLEALEILNILRTQVMRR